MSQPESRLSRKIMSALRAEGIFCFKVHGGPTMMAGLPDIIACVNGRFVGLESKMPGEEDNVSVVQRHVHSLILKASGEVYVVTSVDQALEVCNPI